MDNEIVYSSKATDQIDAAFKEAKTVKGQPTAIIAKTVKG